MDRLLSTLRAIAPTDTPVLITGETGSGKELIARELHRHSSRRLKRICVIDCAALSPSLIEAELFGRERGAYTGADRASCGSFRDADGGSILLDELGELPLEVQSKLLRFTENQEVRPVGALRIYKVDVRLIAATNHDLSEEVKRGRFRLDLFYRLNAVQLRVPPLRERVDDVLPLARHFLAMFTAKYGGKACSFTSRAERWLVEFDWPGNVRELRNRVMRAVVLGQGPQVDLHELDPDCVDGSGQAAGFVLTTSHGLGRRRRVIEFEAELAEVGRAEDARSATGAADSLWHELRRLLREEVVFHLRVDPGAPPPLWDWLQDDAVLIAHELSGSSGRRAASGLGIPKTTFRRKLITARARSCAVARRRSSSWCKVRALLPNLIRATRGSRMNQLDRARQLLLRVVQEHTPGDVVTGCSFMGISPGTFRRWVSRGSAEVASGGPEGTTPSEGGSNHARSL